MRKYNTHNFAFVSYFFFCWRKITMYPTGQKQAHHQLQAFSLQKAQDSGIQRESSLQICLEQLVSLSLIYSICKAFLERVDLAFHGRERIDRLQVGCSKLKGIPGVACLDLHSHTCKQTSPHMCEDIQRYTPVHKHPDPCLLPPGSETLNMSKRTYSKEEKMSWF